MKNPFPYSDSNKRYYTQNYYLRQRYHSKVVKLSLHAGFTCPNRDGTKGTGGCTYCSAKGSGDFAGCPTQPIPAQFFTMRDKLSKKWPTARYIPYFQAFTNTYAPVETLKDKFESVLQFDGVVGLNIATRADCLEDDVVDYLWDLSKRTDLIVELGLQTIHDQTALRINRCHTFAEFLVGYEKLRRHGISVCIHLIDGLPGETHEMMLETAQMVAKLSPHSVKLHLLHILEDTPLADEYRAGKVTPLSLREYVSVVCDQLECLPQETVIQRVTGDGGKDQLLAPLWSLKKFVVMNEIDKELVRRDSWQGKFFSAEKGFFI